MVAFISPHFDDAIGSCGCWIHHLAQAAEQLCVCTIFGGNTNSGFSSFAEELHRMWGLKNPVAERREENTRACSMFNIPAVVLDIPEAIYREHNGQWIYPNAGDIFASISEFDLGLIEQIEAQITSYFSREDSFVFPSAVGRHVDHILVSMVGRRLWDKGYDVTFYHDFSYPDGLYWSDSHELPRIFSEDDLQAKIAAMKEYSSQLTMLFPEGTSRDYFECKNRGKEGVYERYYRIQA